MNKYLITCASITLCALNSIAFGLGEKSYRKIRKQLPHAVTHMNKNVSTAAHTFVPLAIAGGMYYRGQGNDNATTVVDKSPKKGGRALVSPQVSTYFQAGTALYGLGAGISHFSPKVGNAISKAGICLPATALASNGISLLSASMPNSVSGYINTKSSAFQFTTFVASYVALTALEDCFVGESDEE